MCSFFKNFYLYSSGWSPTNYLCFLNRIKYLLKNSVQNSGAGERRDCELVASALQVRFCGSDILSIFLLTLSQNFSVWWSRDAFLAHLLPYSVASLRQGWGSRLLRKKAAGSSSQLPHLSCLICWWDLCRTLPVLPWPVHIPTPCHSHQKFSEAFRGLGCMILGKSAFGWRSEDAVNIPPSFRSKFCSLWPIC